MSLWLSKLFFFCLALFVVLKMFEPRITRYVHLPVLSVVCRPFFAKKLQYGQPFFLANSCYTFVALVAKRLR